LAYSTATTTAALATAAELAAAIVGRLGATSAPGTGAGWWRGRAWRARRGGGSERTGRGVLSVFHSEFLEDEVVTGFQEGGEGSSAMKKGPDVAEALVEATNHVEDEGAIGDDLAKGREIVNHLLQVATVVGDGEIALDEVAKLCLKVDGRASQLPRNLDSTASQACGAVEP
jgi:hypothetical protein